MIVPFGYSNLIELFDEILLGREADVSSYSE